MIAVLFISDLILWGYLKIILELVLKSKVVFLKHGVFGLDCFDLIDEFDVLVLEIADLVQLFLHGGD